MNGDVNISGEKAPEKPENLDEDKKRAEIEKLSLEVNILKKKMEREEEIYLDEKKIKHQFKFWSPVIAPIITTLIAVIGVVITVNKFETEKKAEVKKTKFYYESIILSLEDTAKYESAAAEIASSRDDIETLKNIFSRLTEKYTSAAFWKSGTQVKDNFLSAIRLIYALADDSHKPDLVNLVNNQLEGHFKKGDIKNGDMFIHYLKVFKEIRVEGKQLENVCQSVRTKVNSVDDIALKEEFEEILNKYLKCGVE